MFVQRDRAHAATKRQTTALRKQPQISNICAMSDTENSQWKCYYILLFNGWRKKKKNGKSDVCVCVIKKQYPSYYTFRTHTIYLNYVVILAPICQ